MQSQHQAQSQARRTGCWQSCSFQEDPGRGTRGSHVLSGAGLTILIAGPSPLPQGPCLALKFSTKRTASTGQILTPGCFQLHCRLLAKRMGVGGKMFSALWSDISFAACDYGLTTLTFTKTTSFSQTQIMALVIHASVISSILRNLFPVLTTIPAIAFLFC